MQIHTRQKSYFRDCVVYQTQQMYCDQKIQHFHNIIVGAYSDRAVDVRHKIKIIITQNKKCLFTIQQMQDT